MGVMGVIRGGGGGRVSAARVGEEVGDERIGGGEGVGY